ncbi:hypothetical protein B0H14DRAFT_2790139 [Mycena olivaceomarginata]|nr:hypothetical protein B0H14DRAFT_2790139 [Mycena olivaceomarginata]
MSPAGCCWQNLPPALEDDIHACMKIRRPRPWRSAVQGSYVVLYNDGTIVFDLRGQYRMVETMIRNTQEAARRRGVMYIALNPFVAGEFYAVYGDGSASWNFPTAWSADVTAVSRHIKAMPVPAPAPAPTKPQPALPSTHASMLEAVVVGGDGGPSRTPAPGHASPVQTPGQFGPLASMPTGGSFSSAYAPIAPTATGGSNGQASPSPRPYYRRVHLELLERSTHASRSRPGPIDCHGRDTIWRRSPYRCYGRDTPPIRASPRGRRTPHHHPATLPPGAATGGTTSSYPSFSSGSTHAAQQFGHASPGAATGGTTSSYPSFSSGSTHAAPQSGHASPATGGTTSSSTHATPQSGHASPVAATASPQGRHRPHHNPAPPHGAHRVHCYGRRRAAAPRASRPRAAAARASRRRLQRSSRPRTLRPRPHIHPSPNPHTPPHLTLLHLLLRTRSLDIHRANSISIRICTPPLHPPGNINLNSHPSARKVQAPAPQRPPISVAAAAQPAPSKINWQEGLSLGLKAAQGLNKIRSRRSSRRNNRRNNRRSSTRRSCRPIRRMITPPELARFLEYPREPAGFSGIQASLPDFSAIQGMVSETVYDDSGTGDTTTVVVDTTTWDTGY